MDFVALDVETANSDMASICQIGLVVYKNKTIIDEWVSFIDPQDNINPINTSIHGINEEKIIGAPTINEVIEIIYSYLDNRVVVTHTHFDRVAIKKALEKINLRMPSCTWLDSARVARRTWEEFAWQGYGLSNICETLGYKFQHHNALEDAKAAGYIILCAIEKTGYDITQWLDRVEKPINFEKNSSKAKEYKAIAQEGNPEGDLYGEVIVFTGKLSINRQKAAAVASELGCKVSTRVNKETTILVVGAQNISTLSYDNKSSKHRKAEKLILEGHNIKIISENDFKSFMETGGTKSYEE